ncbi:TDT family transporter [Streptomyces sp. NPDC051018]|uniref:TDT family transporter n=1 Tax=Streptomyces sp. NPDC051018 TaxID=3365639 RepID=UPI00379AEDFC
MVTAVHARPRASAPAVRPVSSRHVGPQWYAPVMGTAIVAVAGAALPVPVPGPALVTVWAVSAVLLVLVAAARAAHWAYHRDQARAHLLDLSVAPFYGCLSMALLSVGTGTLTVGSRVTGESAAVAIAAGLFAAGTVTGLAAAVAVPYLMIVRHRPAPGTASPVWLLPVVAPMVGASFGPLLVPRLPPGQWRAALLLGSLGMFGLSLLATLLILPLVFARLVHHGPLPLALTPSLFLVLGPLGQSTTAVGNAADAAGSAAAHPRGFGAFALLYGVPVTGFALLWLALAGALVVRAVRRGMPFSMTWWAFTFPVGTCVLGAASLADRTGLAALAWLAVLLYGLLVTAWAVVGFRTVCVVRALLGGGTVIAEPARVAAPVEPRTAAPAER